MGLCSKGEAVIKNQGRVGDDLPKAPWRSMELKGPGMSKLKFTPEMFIESFATYDAQERAANNSQEIFDAWLEAQPVVSGKPDKTDGKVYSWWIPETYGDKGVLNTHRAHLVCIEEIEKKECEHRPSHMNMIGEYSNCVECGVKLKAKWEEA